MKKLFVNRFVVLGLLASIFLITSCSDGTNGDDFADLNYASQGSVLEFSNVVNGFFDLGDAANSFVSFDASTIGEAVTGAELFITKNSGESASLGTFSSFPQNVNVPFSDVLNSIGVNISDVAIGDVFTISSKVTTGSGVFTSSETLNLPASCFSDLGGNHTFVASNLQAANGSPCPGGEVTGEVTFTDNGGGTYTCSDLGFGQYESSCWNDGPATSENATFSDVCNKITSGGLDQYNLVYIWVISGVNGSELSMSWSNNYGDSGDVVITKGDGGDWPPLFTN